MSAQRSKTVTTPKCVSMADFTDAQESYLGWCKSCEEFTTSHCEPDATNYQCDLCNEKSVFGAEEALLEGMITVGD